MYMLVLTFIYMSALISVKCDVIKNDNPKQNVTRVKGELLKSLRHVNHFLAAVENKIKNEKEILKKIADNHFPPFASEERRRRDFKVYEAPDINRWNTNPANEPKQPMKKEDFNPILKEVVGNWVRNLSAIKPQDIAPDQIITSIMTVRPGEFKRFNNLQYHDFEAEDPFGIEFEYGGSTLSLPSSTNYITIPEPEATPAPVTVSPFVEKLIQQKRQRDVGYFTVFATTLFDTLRTMTDGPLLSFFSGFREYVVFMKSEHMLDTLGEPGISNVLNGAEKLAKLPGNLARKYATSLTYVLVNQEALTSQNFKEILRAADFLYDDDEGEQLFASMEYLNNYSMDYPAGNITNYVVAEEMMSAMMRPVTRLAGSKEQREFVAALNNLLTDNLPSALRRMQLKNGLPDGSELFQNTSEFHMRASQYQQRNLPRRTKHKKTKHHKKNKTHHKHHHHKYRNHRKMRKIHRNGPESMEEHLTLTTSSRTYAQALRGNYEKNENKIVLDTTTNKVNLIKMHQTRYHIKQSQNPISLSLHKFRVIEKTRTDVQDGSSELRARPSTKLPIFSQAISIFSRPRKDTLLRKIIEASSYSDEEQDLKAQLYRAFDTI